MSNIILGPIIGGLSHSSVNLWARADGEGTLHAWLGTQSDFLDAALLGDSAHLPQGDTFAAIVPITGLEPNTKYYYALTLSDDKPAQPDGAFTTFPAPGTHQDFAFAFGSCFLNATPTSGQAFHALDSQRDQNNLRFLLQIGDQIYADEAKHNGLGKAAITTQDYREVYRHNWSNPNYRQLLKNMPVFMTLDDHEVDNDWAWDDPDRRWGHLPLYQQVMRWLKRSPKDELMLTIHRVRDAMEAYWEHQGIHAPNYFQLPRMDGAGRFVFQEDTEGSFAYTFQYGAAAFFILDTRTMRVSGSEGRFLLGESQWQALETWLLEVRDTASIKFIVTSSTLLFDMFVDVARDRWSGFSKERNRLLYFLAANGLENVYFLAGDIHSAHAVQADLYGPDGKDLRIWEFCSSPFEQQTNPAAWTYIPALSPAIKQQKKHWVIAQHNFGIVQVRFDTQNHPQVSFTVNDTHGEIIKSIQAS